MDIFKNKEVSLSYKYDNTTSKDYELSDYSFLRTLNLNGCEISLLGTIHDSTFSKNKIKSIIDEKNFDLVCPEIPEFVYNYYIDVESFTEKIKDMINSSSFSTKYFLRSILLNSNSRLLFEDFFSLENKRYDVSPSDMILASKFALDRDLNVFFLDLDWVKSERLYLENKSSLSKLYEGFLFRNNLIKVQDKNFLNKENNVDQDTRTKILSDSEDYVLDNLKGYDVLSKAEKLIYRLKDDYIEKTIRSLSRKNESIFVALGLIHYDELLQKINSDNF